MKKTNSAIVVVADTSGLISLLIDTDANHYKALAHSAVFDESPGAVVLPTDVFTELMNVLGKKQGHKKAVAVGQQILANPNYLLIESDKERVEALRQFAKQPAAVSFTDCIVMAFADRLGTKVVFGFDETFAKNGYRLPEAPNQEQAA